MEARGWRMEAIEARDKGGGYGRWRMEVMATKELFGGIGLYRRWYPNHPIRCIWHLNFFKNKMPRGCYVEFTSCHMDGQL